MDAVPSAEVAERLRHRYPRARVSPTAWLIIIGFLALLGLAWLLWAAWVHSTPAVTAQVSAYTVRDAQTVTATLTVGRRDPAVPATCRVVAQSEDFQIVGEREVAVPAGPFELTSVEVKMTTLRRAVSVSSRGCTSQG